MITPEHPPMRTSEVARLFRVDPSTVTRWAQAGRLSHFLTLGGQRRFDRAEVLALYRAEQMPRRTDG